MSLTRMQAGIVGRGAALGPTPSIAAVGTVSQGNVATLTPGYPSGITAGALLLLRP